MGIQYFVNPSQFAQHPIYESIIKENPHLGFSSPHEPGSAAYRHDLTKFIRLPPQLTPSGTAAPVVKVPSKLAKFERMVERSYIHQLQQICRQEVRDLATSAGSAFPLEQSWIVGAEADLGLFATDSSSS